MRGEPLTRFAIHVVLLLRKAVERASSGCAILKKKRVSPQVVRHGTAMALLQSGVDSAVIALWLGHESIETTNVYAHANLAMKETALARVLPAARRSGASKRTIPGLLSSNRSDCAAFLSLSIDRSPPELVPGLFGAQDGNDVESGDRARGGPDTGRRYQSEEQD
jgi:hypothetical protein